MLQAQDVRVDPRHRRVWRGETEVVLSRKEFDLLLALISRAGVLVSREDLMRDVWKTTFWTSSKTIDVHLGWVRRKLGDDPRRPTLITTIRGKGLRFETTLPTQTTEPSGPIRSGSAARTAAPTGPGTPAAAVTAPGAQARGVRSA